MSTSDRTEQQLNIGSDLEIARSLKRTLEETYGPIIYAEHKFWTYSAPIWRPLDERLIRECIYRFDGEHPAVGGMAQQIRITRRKVLALMGMLAEILEKPGFFDAPAVGINAENGFITFDGEGKPELMSHSADHRQRHAVPAPWDGCSIADIPPESLLHQLLHGAFDGDRDAADKRKLIAEMIGCVALGYATKLKEPKALIFFGETAGNGKSAIIDLVRGFLPASEVSNLPLDFLSIPHYAANLRGKRLNASDELSAKAILSDAFKLAVTGEPMTTRKLYKDADEFCAFALHIYATNELPTFQTGMDRGVRRRLMIVTFNNIIPPDKRVERIGEKVNEREAALVLALAVEGAGRLIRNGKFTEPASSAQALNDLVFGGDPVLAWVSACCDYPDDMEPLRTRHAYEHFRGWAAREGFDRSRLPAINAFVGRVKAVLPECDPRGRAGAHYHRDKNGGHFRGLALKK